MKPDMIKDVCEDWAAEARVPAGLADRVLRRRTRQRSVKIVLTAGSTALLAGAAAVAVSVAGPASQSPLPSSQPAIQTLSADTTLQTDLGDTFPRHLVAAGHTAVAAYYTNGNNPKEIERTWFLYDPASGTYEKTSYAYLDVAPGMHLAAVLEGPLPAARVGILDMSTRKITRWIPVDHKVGGLSWSPDGSRLLLTAYDRDPDLIAGASSSRTGYYLVDTGSGHAEFHALAPDKGNPGPRQDLGWSRDGKLIWSPTATDPTKTFYDPSGDKRSTPPHEAEGDQDAGLSPNGTLLPNFGPAPGPAVTVTNVTTGKSVAVLPIEQAKAWADDTQLFAIGCNVQACKGKGEFHNRLLLVNLKGKVTPLTGYHRTDDPDSWVPVFTHR